MWLEGRGSDERDSRAFTNYHANLLQSLRLRASLDLFFSWGNGDVSFRRHRH